jgi:hypothetical protein
LKTNLTVFIAIIAQAVVAATATINPDLIPTAQKVVLKSHGLQPDGITIPTFDDYGLDYNGPKVSETWGGVPMHTIVDTTYFTNCYGNYVGIQHLTNNQVSWFEITVSPNRDSTNRNGGVLAYILGMNGSVNESISAWYRLVGSTNWYNLTTLNNLGYKPAYDPTHWNAYAWDFATTNDIVLHFEYDAGPYASDEYWNAGGVDYLCWEGNPPSNPLLLRAEMAWDNNNPLIGADTDWHALPNAMRISWPKNGLTESSYHLYVSQSLNGPWYLYGSAAIYTTLDNTRYVAYGQIIISEPTRYFKLATAP